MSTARFNETSLLLAVCDRWGENGAHADVLRDLMRRAGVEPDALLVPGTGLPPEVVEQIRCAPDRLTATRIARAANPIDLRSALRIVDSIRAGEEASP